MAGPARGVSGLVFTLVGAAFLVLGSGGAEACVGARPLAMGGAFIAVADDSSAAYWNPAGLVALRHRELALTYTVNNRSRYNYDEFLSWAGPGPAATAGGLSIIKEHTGAREGSGAYEASDWLVYSVAKSLSGGFSVGANVRYEVHIRRAPGMESVSGTRWGFDVALLYRASTELALGLLVQDVGLSPIRWQSGREEAVRANVRPGIAYKPDARTIMALDIYDLGACLVPPPDGQSSTFAVRAGIERRLTGNLAARIGYYGISPGMGAITGGAGWDGRTWQVDYAYLGSATVPGHPGLGGTHQIGVTFKF
ncbi:MAG: hypothetical protein AB1774_05190 [Bacillota bacterium]